MMIFITVAYIGRSQEITGYCNRDSLQYDEVDSLINFMIIPERRTYRYLGDTLRAFVTRDDTLCSIKNYALVFDRILEMGLDYTTPLPNGPPRNNVLTLDTVMNKAFADEYQRLDAYTQKMRGLFYLFVDVKDEYEKKFSCIEGSKHLRKEIDALIRYGTWTHPNELKKILLLKLKHIDRTKPNKDYRDSLKKAKKKKKAGR